MWIDQPAWHRWSPFPAAAAYPALPDTAADNDRKSPAPLPWYAIFAAAPLCRRYRSPHTAPVLPPPARFLHVIQSRL